MVELQDPIWVRILRPAPPDFVSRISPRDNQRRERKDVLCQASFVSADITVEIGFR